MDNYTIRLFSKILHEKLAKEGLDVKIEEFKLPELHYQLMINTYIYVGVDKNGLDMEILLIPTTRSHCVDPTCCLDFIVKTIKEWVKGTYDINTGWTKTDWDLPKSFYI